MASTFKFFVCFSVEILIERVVAIIAITIINISPHPPCQNETKLGCEFWARRWQNWMLKNNNGRIKELVLIVQRGGGGGVDCQPVCTVNISFHNWPPWRLIKFHVLYIVRTVVCSGLEHKNVVLVVVVMVAKLWMILPVRREIDWHCAPCPPPSQIHSLSFFAFNRYATAF